MTRILLLLLVVALVLVMSCASAPPPPSEPLPIPVCTRAPLPQEKQCAIYCEEINLLADEYFECIAFCLAYAYAEGKRLLEQEDERSEASPPHN